MIKFRDCDIFKIDADVICHQVNCRGVMNFGIAKRVKELYPQVYDAYFNYCESVKAVGSKTLLGRIQNIKISSGTTDKYICNLFAQDNFGYEGRLFTNYEALKECFEQVKIFHFNSRIAIPYLIGCGKGGGDWKTIETIILNTFSRNDVTICRRKKAPRLPRPL